MAMARKGALLKKERKVTNPVLFLTETLSDVLTEHDIRLINPIIPLFVSFQRPFNNFHVCPAVSLKLLGFRSGWFAEDRGLVLCVLISRHEH